MQEKGLPTLLVVLLFVAFLGTFGLKCKEGAGFGPVNGTIVECPTINNNSRSFCMQVDCKTNDSLYPVFNRFGCTNEAVRGDCTEKVKAWADMDAFAMEGWACQCQTEPTGVEARAPHNFCSVNVTAKKKNGSGGRLRVGIATILAAAGCCCRTLR